MTSSLKTHPSGTERFKGMAVSDILLLPEALQPLATWLVRQQREVNLTEIAAFLKQPEFAARNQVEALIQRGFVQIIQTDGETRYQVRLDHKRSSHVPEVIWQTLAPGNPLAVIRNPSGEQAVVAGQDFDFYVTVSNQGSQSALVDVYIDETSQTIYQWCVAPHDRLALGSQQSGEVVFHFQIPPQALPGVYDYALVIDAPEHYPEDTPIRYTQQLQVLPPVQQVVRVNDPTFALQPATSSTQPAVLQPGQMLEVSVLVHNTSDRVDHFRLTCPDLPEGWLTLRYPEGLETPGAVLQTDGLNLNPGAKGQIILLLHPPLDALAGAYSPTVRLHSANNPDLVLLDLVYLQILPVYALNLELRTRLGRVKQGAGQYEIRLLNDGNTDREIILSPVSAEEDILCKFILEPGGVHHLPPRLASTTDLRVQPIKWWRRPLLGGGRSINFYIDVEDPQQLPLPTDRLQGTLIWEARPLWQFLLFLLTTVGALALLAFLIWTAFFKAPPPPKILEFSAAGSSYQEAGNDSIRLNWQIRNPKQLQALRLSRQSADGRVGQPIVYDFSKLSAGETLPKPLQPFCTLERLLICNGIPTDARKAGSYVFELAMIPKGSEGEPTDVKKTGTIDIQAQFPTVVSFKINDQEAASKYLVPIHPQQPVKKIILSWQVQGGKDVQVELLPAPGTVPAQGSIPYFLTQRPATETITLKVTNASGQQMSKAVTIETFDPTLPKPTPSPGQPVLPGMVLPPPPPSGQPLPVIKLPAASLPPPPPAGALTPIPLPSALPPATSGAPTQPGGTPTQPGGQPSPNPNAPTPTDPDTLSPAELPPQFE